MADTAIDAGTIAGGDQTYLTTADESASLPNSTSLENKLTFGAADAAKHFDMTGSTLKAEGTDVAIPVTAQAKGGGRLIVSDSELTGRPGVQIMERADNGTNFLRIEAATDVTTSMTHRFPAGTPADGFSFMVNPGGATTANYDWSSNLNTAISIPKGTTAERPGNTAGRMRYNTDDGGLEFNDGAAWRGLGTSGTWTPAFTFDTPGDLSVVYTKQNGTFDVCGRVATLFFDVTGTPTFTTSSSFFYITGSPFTNGSLVEGSGGIHNKSTSLFYSGAQTQVSPVMWINRTDIVIQALGATANTTTVGATTVTSGVALTMRGYILLRL